MASVIATRGPPLVRARRRPAHLPHDEDVRGARVIEVTLAGSTDVDKLLGLPERATSVVVAKTDYPKNQAWPGDKKLRVPRPAGLVSERPVWHLHEVVAFADERGIAFDEEAADRIRKKQTLPGGLTDVVSVTELAKAARYESGKQPEAAVLARMLERADVPVIRVAGMFMTLRSLARAATVSSNREGRLIWARSSPVRRSGAVSADENSIR
jgi:hypothetical protein